jgi:PAS domain S-box-containing protein
MAKITEQYILKPFDEHELDTAIQLSCSKHAMEKALRENERTIRALLNVTTDPLFILDADGAFLALNEMMAKRLGKPAEEVLHMPITGLIAGGGITLPLAERVELAKSGKPIRFEEAVKDQWYDTHIYPITDAAGNVTHIAVFSHDITDRKKAADELAVANLNLLQEKENLLIFTAALDSMDDSVIITDTYGVIKYVNHAFERKFGYKPSEVIGKHLSEFKSPESTYALDRQSFLGDHKSVWTGYPVMRNKFGLRIPLSLKSSPIIKENQTINRVFVLREKL